MSRRRKIILTISLIPVGLIIAIAVFLAILFIPYFNQPKPIIFGATFSEPYTKYLGLDWQKTYLAVLDELKIKYLRLVAPWDQIEPQENKYNFEDLDWQIKEAEKRGIKIILVFGHRVPRWPECALPLWVSGLAHEKIEEKALVMTEEVVNHYKDLRAIEVWQIENEPLFPFFGKCPWPDKNFLKREITLVRSLDERPVLITDSGELSTWWRTARLGDLFGTTMYRVVWNRYIGYFYYDKIFSPAFYRLKARLAGLNPSEVWITELQAESWGGDSGILKLENEELKKSMDVARFKEHLDFASRTGFSRAYLWGVEYWYWLKELRGDDSLWEVGKGIWKEN